MSLYGIHNISPAYRHTRQYYFQEHSSGWPYHTMEEYQDPFRGLISKPVCPGAVGEGYSIWFKAPRPHEIVVNTVRGG